MKRTFVTFLLVSGMGILPAAAQTTAPSAGAGKTAAQCETDWKVADKNNDGSLDKAEMDANKSLLPSSMGDKSTITHQEFVTACSTPMKK